MVHNGRSRFIAKFVYGLPFLILASLPSPGQITSAYVAKRPTFVTQRVEPVFTPEALKVGLIGNGTVDVWIDETGIPTEVKLVSWRNVNSDSPDRLGLDRAAMAAIRKWRFKPSIASGKPVPFQIRIGFLLHPKGSTFTTSDPEPLSSRPQP